MGAVRERIRCILFAVALLAGCQSGSGDMIAHAGPERAAALVAFYARQVGAADRRMGPDGDVSFGESGLYYDAAKDVLYGRVYVNMARIKDAPPARLDAYRRMAVALNDVGGMFDRGGGYFVLDENRQGYFLVRPFSVPHTTPESLDRDMARMRAVAARWNSEWFFTVAMIMHGNRKPPERPVPLPD